MQVDIQPGHYRKGLGCAKWQGEANFHLCINQTGMWLQLIALGRSPTRKLLFFPQVGPEINSLTATALVLAEREGSM